jgi:hypothetical protein
MTTTHVERRSQRDTERLARAVLEYQIELIRETCVRRGQSQEDADEVVRTCLKEFREGDTSLLDFSREKSLH